MTQKRSLLLSSAVIVVMTMKSNTSSVIVLTKVKYDGAVSAIGRLGICSIMTNTS
jgi:hypothetical protein